MHDLSVLQFGFPEHVVCPHTAFDDCLRRTLVHARESMGWVFAARAKRFDSEIIGNITNVNTDSD
jgi:hypothetical protein